jgi:hypothetical protein
MLTNGREIEARKQHHAWRLCKDALPPGVVGSVSALVAAVGPCSAAKRGADSAGSKNDDRRFQLRRHYVKNMESRAAYSSFLASRKVGSFRVALAGTLGASCCQPAFVEVGCRDYGAHLLLAKDLRIDNHHPKVSGRRRD